MKKGWETKTLGEVCTLRPPKAEARQRLAMDSHVSFLPMEDLGIDVKHPIPRRTKKLGDVQGSYTYFADGDVLLAKVTPCFQNGKLGIAKDLTNGVGFGSSEFFVLRPHSDLDSEYLYYFLSRADFKEKGVKRMGGAVGLQRVPPDYLLGETLPVPPLAEQQQIVALLDEAFEGIATAKANAEKNLQNARALFESHLNALFTQRGDGWVERTVKAIAATAKGSIRTGPFGSQLLHSEFVDEGIAVLGIDNAVANEFRWGKSRFITKDKYRQLERYRVHPGDVLITIMGTCGRCAIVPDDIPAAINTKHICCITLDRKQCLPSYLHIYFLHSPQAQAFLAKHAKGAIMAGLNMGLIQELPVMLPPIKVQSAIVDAANDLRKESKRLESIYQRKLAALDELKKSLLHQAFSGQL